MQWKRVCTWLGCLTMACGGDVEGGDVLAAARAGELDFCEVFTEDLAQRLEGPDVVKEARDPRLSANMNICTYRAPAEQDGVVAPYAVGNYNLREASIDDAAFQLLTEQMNRGSSKWVVSSEMPYALVNTTDSNAVLFYQGYFEVQIASSEAEETELVAVARQLAEKLED